MTLATIGQRVSRGLAALMAVGVLVGGIAHADDQDRHVKIVNDTDFTITHFYASNVAVTDWQEDILGQAVLKPGDTVNINIDDGSGHCKYDFKAVFDDGTSTIKNNVDVCHVGTFRFHQ